MIRQHQSSVEIPLPRRRPEREPSVEGDNGARLAEVAQNPVQAESSLLDQVAQPDATPTFAGFEADRYQEHDASIEALVAQFNEDKAGFIGATPDQAVGIGDLDPALVKAWLVQETGGGDKRSRNAWDADPAQVNVPGDWGAEKADDQMGLAKPTKRNEGDVDTNLKAAITYLTRKGFSTSGKAPEDLLGGQEFGGWQAALENYNGRATKMASGEKYKEAYAQQILDRASSPDTEVPIELGPLARRTRGSRK